MSSNASFSERANAYDENGLVKREVDKSFILLKEFRVKFPFAENLRSIEWLDADKLFKLNPDEVGEFFCFLEDFFKPLTSSKPGGSNVYRNARLQINDFKKLLRTAVDDRKSLAQKVDAPWERIGGLGQDKHLAKKIIYCFNYAKGNVLPIIVNQHLRHFVNHVTNAAIGQTKYLSLGQEYEHYTKELLTAKNNLPLTRTWNTLYFARFLYNIYPPPDIEHPTDERKTTAITDEQLDMQGFVKLLGQLQTKGKISGQQFRENRELWIKQPSERNALTQRLKKLLTE